MEKTDIVSTQTVPNAQGTAVPVAFINTHLFASTEEVLDEAVEMGNAVNADAIVSFQFQTQPTANRNNRRWRGSGTAIKIE